ncbi:hypothetical protein K1T71_006256 [Dendrolimus kikuchii]|uniref:Uncharacterized protein n=1 Tax=Dendrolimus kikuchii TaxID=765133 RepID=A0ACC1D3D8_9NEOP|nr:hypothetical protein K1T71_006256 [Dendrolimus kikuchii]
MTVFFISNIDSTVTAMSRKKLTDSDLISHLIEDVSTPELTPERDPYSDDGEFGSDQEFEPNYDDMSSTDSDPAESRKIQRNMTRRQFSGSNIDARDVVKKNPLCPTCFEEWHTSYAKLGNA